MRPYSILNCTILVVPDRTNSVYIQVYKCICTVQYMEYCTYCMYPYVPCTSYSRKGFNNKLLRLETKTAKGSIKTDGALRANKWVNYNL